MNYSSTKPENPKTPKPQNPKTPTSELFIDTINLNKSSSTMERVEDFKDKLIKGSQNVIFSKIDILVSFALILTREIVMFLLFDRNSDANQPFVYYYIFFLTFQILWSYSSWIMLLLFFYPNNDDLPNAFKSLKQDNGYQMEIFKRTLAKLWLCGKFQVKCNKNVYVTFFVPKK